MGAGARGRRGGGGGSQCNVMPWLLVRQGSTFPSSSCMQLRLAGQLPAADLPHPNPPWPHPQPTRRAVQLRPHDARMWNAMGNCYQQEQLGMLDAAIRCHRRALPYDKEGVAVHELVCVCVGVMVVVVGGALFGRCLVLCSQLECCRH